jgi:hypothetical protein
VEGRRRLVMAGLKGALRYEVERGNERGVGVLLFTNREGSEEERRVAPLVLPAEEIVEILIELQMTSLIVYSRLSKH